MIVLRQDGTTAYRFPMTERFHFEAVYVKNADENVMARKFLKIGRYKTRT
jgi:hypothetical protein